MDVMTVRAIGAALAAGALLAGCDSSPGAIANALDSSIVGTAVAATPSGSDLWKERGAGEAVPATTVVPQATLAPLVKQLKPGVVNVYTTSIVQRRSVRRAPGMGDPFEEFFRQFHDNQVPDERRQSLGSGFIINSKGYVITNNHVVEGASEIRVKLDDGREFKASIVGRDPKTDIALLKLKGENGGELKDLPIVYLGDSDRTEVGDFVIACGNPFGLDHSVSLGIVSAKERVIGAGPYDDFIQTDAAINPGNSGGPLFNLRGEVVGVNTAIVAQGQGIGFAVPINMAKALLPQLLNNHRITRGWLGVSIQEVTPELAKMLKLDRTEGALVAGVMRKSPAESAGLRPGDVVVSVNGKKVDSYRELSRSVAFMAPGTKAKLEVLREGKVRALEIKIGEHPEDEQAVQASAVEGDDSDQDSPAADRLGLTVQGLGEARAQKLGVDGGVQVSQLNADGPAARAGLRIGDVIVEVQKQAVRSVQDYAAAVRNLKPGDMALIRLQREQASIYIAVRIPR